MPTIPRRVREASGRPPTSAELARRAQLIAVTIELLAEHGYARCSLQRIADAAGITKAAVIYHFATKQEVIRAAYDSVIAALTASMQARIEAAHSASGRVEAYVSALIAYFDAHPQHGRVISEAISEANHTGIADRPTSEARWRPLAALIDAARAEGPYRDDVDSRTLALILGGAIDAVVGESLRDPHFDLDAATGVLLRMLQCSTPSQLIRSTEPPEAAKPEQGSGR